MTLYNPEAPRPVAQPAEQAPVATGTPPGGDDEIDLRAYVMVLFNWWLEILLVTLLIAAAAAAYVYYEQANAPITYEASSTVVVARVVTNVNMATGLVTQVDAPGSALQGGPSRRATLVQLVQNGQIAERVYADLEEMPGMELYTPTQLLRAVTATSLTDLNQTGDLIEIRFVSRNPELAAAVVNSWAEHYVQHINSLFGEMPADIIVSIEEQLAHARNEHDAAQAALEAFMGSTSIPSLEREIGSKQSMIATLRSAETMALSQVLSETVGTRMLTLGTYLSAGTNNRLLAFQREQMENLTLLDDLIISEVENRRLALRTEQNMRRQLFEQYAQAELNNRLLALEAEQTEKARLFEKLSQSEVDARIAVYTHQFDDRIARLTNDYEQRRVLNMLLTDARGLQAQVAQGAEANTDTVTLALVLLKTQVFASSRELPSNLQLNISEWTTGPLTAEEILADLGTLVNVIETRVAEMEQSIATVSNEIFVNEDYLALTGARGEDDPLYELVQQTYLDLFELGELSAVVSQDEIGALSAAIAQKYDELFHTGALVNTSLALGPPPSAGVSDDALVAADADAEAGAEPDSGTVAGDVLGEEAGSEVPAAAGLWGQMTPISEAIENQYPYLFQLGNLAQMAEMMGGDTELDQVTASQIEDLLQMQGLNDIPGYSALTDSSSRIVGELEVELRDLQAELEHQMAMRQRLFRQRERTITTEETLTNKLVELELQQAVSSREVSLGGLALVPDAPMPQSGSRMNIMIGGVGGLLFAVILALAAHMVGIQPPSRRLRRGYA